MEIHNLLDIKSRAELREWLIQNHKTEKECWVVVKRGRPTDDSTFLSSRMDDFPLWRNSAECRRSL